MKEVLPKTCQGILCGILRKRDLNFANDGEYHGGSTVVGVPW